MINNYTNCIRKILQRTALILFFSRTVVGVVCAQTPLSAFHFLSRWDDDTLAVASPTVLRIQYSSCWGMAINGHEYAIAGGAQNVLVLEVTDPTKPVLAGKFRGTATTIREFKSYKNRLYAVAGGGNEGLMIIDFSKAPDTIKRVYYSNEFFNYSHTITLDTLAGRIYLNGGDAASNGVTILDISKNPDKPTLIGNVPLPGGYVHDAYVRKDTLYVSSGYEGYYIFDMHDPLAPVELAKMSTGGYNHNSWLTAKGDFAYYTEEIPAGQPVRIVDLRKLKEGDIESAGTILNRGIPGGPSAPIPHNLYIKDNWLFVSQYEDGLLLYDISNPLQPALLDRYDSHPENIQYNGYYGNWGSYPWLPSGNIVTTDMQNGIFMLKITNSVAVAEIKAVLSCDISPNPVADLLHVTLDPSVQQWSYCLTDMTGRNLLNGKVSGTSEKWLDTAFIVPGCYVLQVADHAGKMQRVKVVKG